MSTSSNVIQYNDRDNVHPNPVARLVNLTSHQIDINVRDDETGQVNAFMLRPGSSDGTPVPAEVLDSSDFYRFQVSSRNIIVVEL